MISEEERKSADSRDAAAKAIGARASRIEHGRKQDRDRIWFGLGMFGVVGWSIAVPTLAGIALGLWLDHALPAPFSWTVALLLAGVIVGVWTAVWWLHKEGSSE